ncbi:creatininase family protein [Candidatus Poribacteria bacterium]
MTLKVNYRKTVEYELMLGREATAAVKEYPVGYLPIGCLERHGDHLPMGLDVIKAHKICCIVAQAIGGVVFPAHFYAGIHKMTRDQINRSTGQWGNIYTDDTAKANLVDIINQMEILGIKVLVLYSGHYPHCQIEMIQEIAEDFRENPDITVIPFSEPLIMQGDHAGISETSLMLYLDRSLTDMTRISAANYQDHGWRDANTPEKATVAKGEADVEQIITHLEGLIKEALKT